MPAESKTAVFAAITGNVCIAVAKFTAAAFTGSSAMISEGIHSLVDTGNGVLLWVGLERSRKPPDEEHPFGHGKELYFWSLIVAISIFGIGGGMSTYEGILHILHPSPLENAVWSYSVLGIAMFFEGASFTVALRQFLRTNRGKAFFSAVHRSKDPATYTVMYEDSAALLGLVVALVATYLGNATGNPYYDGAGSILIGLLLAGVAVMLAYESRGLLIGESVHPDAAAHMRSLAERDDAVRKVQRLLTMHLGPDEVLVNMDLEFNEGLSAAEMESAIDRIAERLRSEHPEIAKLFIEPDLPESPGPRRASFGS